MAAPFVVIATFDERGADASPRGGPPGFVRALDTERLAVGDLSGNNRLDTFANVVERAAVGMLFLIAGMDETLRVNGRGTITVDPEVLEATTVDGRTPRVALGIDAAPAVIAADLEVAYAVTMWQTGGRADP